MRGLLLLSFLQLHIAFLHQKVHLQETVLIGRAKATKLPLNASCTAWMDVHVHVQEAHQNWEGAGALHVAKSLGQGTGMCLGSVKGLSRAKALAHTLEAAGLADLKGVSLGRRCHLVCSIMYAVQLLASLAVLKIYTWRPASSI